MSPQEREQLVQFLGQLQQVPPVQKDADADSLIRDACTRQPDAPYLLVQRALLMEHALQQAQAQNARLQSELEQARTATRGNGFLDGNAWGSQPGRSVAPAPTQSYSPAPAAPVPAAGGWSSGWLGNVATTAAGVVAGSFLFQGIEHLLSGHHGGSSWFGGNDNPLSQGLAETTIVNNYYDSGAGSAGDFDAAALDGLDDGDSSNWI